MLVELVKVYFESDKGAASFENGRIEEGVLRDVSNNSVLK